MTKDVVPLIAGSKSAGGLKALDLSCIPLENDSIDVIARSCTSLTKLGFEVLFVCGFDGIFSVEKL